LTDFLGKTKKSSDLISPHTAGPVPATTAGTSIHSPGIDGGALKNWYLVQSSGII
jgi:hypothetical protein